MDLYSVGRSSFGELRGVEQFVTDRGVAAQVNSLIAESVGRFAGGGVLSVNEAVRSRRSQEIKRAAWEAFQRGGPWAPLAAILYTSTHDLSRGHGLDLGVTMPDGRNRALTASEHAWVIERGGQRGIRWTGKDFRPTPEWWHFNGGYPVTLPALTGAVTFPTSEEDDMTPEQDRKLTAVYEYLFMTGPENGGTKASAQIASAFRDAAAAMKEAKAAAIDAYETRKMVKRLVDDTADEASIPRLSRALGTRLTGLATVTSTIAGGVRAIADAIRAKR